jgi:MraZ protein
MEESGNPKRTGMFQGNFDYAIDDKSRLSIPSPFRQEIQKKKDDRLSITQSVRGLSPCLEVYPFADWVAMIEEYTKLPKFDQRAKDVRTYIVGNAHECSVDNQGRILIAPSLREYADLQKEVVVSGDVERFCIWNKELWLSFRKKVDQNAKRDPQYLYFPSS